MKWKLEWRVRNGMLKGRVGGERASHDPVYKRHSCPHESGCPTNRSHHPLPPTLESASAFLPFLKLSMKLSASSPYSALLAYIVDTPWKRFAS